MEYSLTQINISAGQMDLSFLDSITDATDADRGNIGVSGSHGGMYAATYASRAGLRAVVLNDAGIGKDNAGIGGIEALDSVGMAGVAVSADSAEIGSARETFEHGVISFVNNQAAGLGLKKGDRLVECVEKLLTASAPTTVCDTVEETRFEYEVSAGMKELAVLCVDSAALIAKQDAGKVIVTGSHGGLIGGDPARACKADAQLVVFNDAGGGKNQIGHSRLAALDERNIAAITLDCWSCRIGDALSALEAGVVSKVNHTGAKLGVTPKASLIEQLRHLFVR